MAANGFTNGIVEGDVNSFVLDEIALFLFVSALFCNKELVFVAVELIEFLLLLLLLTGRFESLIFFVDIEHDDGGPGVFSACVIVGDGFLTIKSNN